MRKHSKALKRWSPPFSIRYVDRLGDKWWWIEDRSGYGVCAVGPNSDDECEAEAIKDALNKAYKTKN
jgi:hypothetical protein